MAERKVAVRGGRSKEDPVAGLMRKGMSWLGLGPDEDYADDYEYYDDDQDMVDLTEDVDAPAPAPRAVPRRAAAMPENVPSWDHGDSASVRVLNPQPLRPQSLASSPLDQPLGRGVVRTLPSAVSAKPHLVTPTSFNDAQEVGDWFRRRQPVIVNLQGIDRDLARRLLDFASGVAYGLSGSVERIASHVYLLTPVDMEISADDRRNASSRDLVDDRH